MNRSLFTRVATVAAAVGVLTLAIAAPASAHVTVNPGTATQGGYTKVTFRVPNETDNTDTTKLEVNLPTDTPIASVSLKPVAGWTAVTVESKLATPVTTDDGQVTEAISKITWTATPAAAIKPGQFQEFDVSLGPLPKTGQLVFKALQTYSDGTIVRWIDEPASDGTEPEHPAPTLKLTPADATAAAAPVAGAPTVTAAASTDGDGDGTPWGVAGVVLGLIALVLGLLAYRRSGQSAAVPATVATGKETVDTKS
jgi:uncharacterized protein YcnI